MRLIPEQIRCIAVLPLRTAEAVMGTFNVGSSRVGSISADQQVFLEAAATRLAAALHSAQVLTALHATCERLQKECDLQKSALKKSPTNWNWESPGARRRSRSSRNGCMLKIST